MGRSIVTLSFNKQNHGQNFSSSGHDFDRHGSGVFLFADNSEQNINNRGVKWIKPVAWPHVIRPRSKIRWTYLKGLLHALSYKCNSKPWSFDNDIVVISDYKKDYDCRKEFYFREIASVCKKSQH